MAAVMIKAPIRGVLELLCEYFKVEDLLLLIFQSYVMLVGSLPSFLDGICQWPDKRDHAVTKAGRELVEAILVKASDRLELDDIVGHPFIAGSDQDAHRQRCQSAGVGRKSNREVWSCVGTEQCVNSIRNPKGAMTQLGFEWA
jgi:hypothetical protein